MPFNSHVESCESKVSQLSHGLGKPLCSGSFSSCAIWEWCCLPWCFSDTVVSKPSWGQTESVFLLHPVSYVSRGFPSPRDGYEVCGFSRWQGDSELPPPKHSHASAQPLCPGTGTAASTGYPCPHWWLSIFCPMTSKEHLLSSWQLWVQDITLWFWVQPTS